MGMFPLTYKVRMQLLEILGIVTTLNAVTLWGSALQTGKGGK